MASLSHLQNHVDFTWGCPFTKTGKRSAHSTCAKLFAQEMGFQLIDTSDDGNCFFYALAKFGKRANYGPLLLDLNEKRNARLLRETLVDHMEDNLEHYATYLINNNNTGQTPEEQIAELREDGVWASSAGDLVPVAAADAFGIHINLYNINVLNSQDEVQLNQIRSSRNTDVVVSIIRVREGHFELLWPRSGQFSSFSSSSSSMPSSSSSSMPSSYTNYQQEAIHAAHLAVQAAQIAVSAVKNTNTSSLTSNEKKLNQMVQNLNQLSFGNNASSTRSRRTKASTTKKASSTRYRKKKNSSPPRSFSHANNNNNDLRRALEESMQYQY